jgi:hypothetical protein
LYSITLPIDLKTGIFVNVGWFGSLCLTPLLTKLNLYRGGQFNFWKKLEYQSAASL